MAHSERDSPGIKNLDIIRCPSSAAAAASTLLILSTMGGYCLLSKPQLKTLRGVFQYFADV